MSKYTCLILVSFLAAVVALAASGPAWAQPERLVAESELKPFEDIPVPELVKLLSGEIPVDDKAKKDIALMAKYYVYSMTLPERQKDGTVIKRREGFHERIQFYVVKEGYKEKNKDVRLALAKEMIACFKTVFERNAMGEPKLDMASCVNAALMLPTFAQLESPDIIDFLTDLVRDRGRSPVAWASALTGLAATPMGQGPVLSATTLVPTREYGKFDAVKLLAFKALQVYLAPHPKELDLDFSGTGFLDKEKRQKLAERVNPLIDYILYPPYLASKAEIDGYRFIRCEAIKALALIPVPYVPDQPDAKNKTPGKILAPTAYALMRVLAKGPDALSPPANLSEKMYAALGLCQIDASIKLDENLVPAGRYNQELAPPLVGAFLGEFVQAYQQDLTIFTNPDLKLPPRLPWKVFSKTIELALKDAPKNFTSAAAKGVLADVTKTAQTELSQMWTWKQVNPAPLQSLVNGLKAPDPVVYQGTPYQVRLK